MKILFASTNRGKARELVRILHKHEILLPHDLGIDYDYEETGTTYLDNAFGKAMTLFQQTGLPSIGEDSGLSVPALNGEPGVYSARYGSDGGEILSDNDRNIFFLEKMKEIKERDGFFVSSMVIVLDEYRFFVSQETIHGEIAYKSAGTGGFGYDPVFFIREYGKTMAELSDDEKNRISHRGRAGRVIASVLDNLEM